MDLNKLKKMSRRLPQTAPTMPKKHRKPQVLYYSGWEQNDVVKNPFTFTYNGKKWKFKEGDRIPNSVKALMKKRASEIKNEINYLLYHAKSYNGNRLGVGSPHEVLTITVLKPKAKHLDFLLNRTAWKGKGEWVGKGRKGATKTFAEDNAIFQIEYLEARDESLGHKLKKLFNELNDVEIGEQSLYTRSEDVEDSSLPLEKWR